jgi:hypothetical protein
MQTCIERFGPERCMFESNFPVEKLGIGWATLWNAFKRIAEGASAEEKLAFSVARRGGCIAWIDAPLLVFTCFGSQVLNARLGTISTPGSCRNTSISTRRLS